MRGLIAVILLAAAGWSGYWFVGARALDRGIAEAIDRLEAAGWRIETADRDVRGFPNRFDTVIEDPRVTHLGGGITWSAPILQVMALSYRPNRVIVALPGQQRLEGPFGDARIRSERARGSATFMPVPDLTLHHSNVVIDDLDITTGAASLDLGRLLFATRLPEDDGSGRAHNIGLTLDDLVLPPAMADRLGPEAARIDGATLDATLSLSRPLGRAALEDGVTLESVRIDRLDVDWADVALAANGMIEIGPDGVPDGRITLSVTNWRRAVEIAAAAGLIPEGQANALTQGLRVLAGLSDDATRLDAPLDFRDGDIFLGPVSLGPAPRIR